MRPDSGLGRFQHIGVAVKDIDRAAAALAALFSARSESETVHDRNQAVRVKFMRLGDLRVELLEPAESPSPLDSILERGIGLYHVCYEVDDLDGELSRLRAGGVKVVSPPKPAVALGDRRVAFVMYQGLMIELLEAKPA